MPSAAWLCHSSCVTASRAAPEPQAEPATEPGAITTIVRTPGVRNEERETIAMSYRLLERVGLDGVADEFSSNLSYGAQRRLEIARALATEPFLGVRASKTYTFFVITGPVGAYYAGGLKPVRIAEGHGGHRSTCELAGVGHGLLGRLGELAAPGIDEDDGAHSLFVFGRPGGRRYRCN